MNILKVGDGPFTGSNVGTIQMKFGKSVDKNRRGVYEIKKNKFVSFIYLAKQQPNGEWVLPSGVLVTNWFNKPNNDNSEFVRVCKNGNLKRHFTDPNVKYAVFKKTKPYKSSFYGVFRFKEANDDYTECTFERIAAELNCEEWK